MFVPEIREASRSYELSEDENVLLKAYSTLSPRRRRALLELLTAFTSDK